MTTQVKELERQKDEQVYQAYVLNLWLKKRPKLDFES